MTEVICSDYTKKDGTVLKGCGKRLRWPTDAEKAAGQKRPVNLDGTPHSHDAPSQPAAQAKSMETVAKNVLILNEEWVRKIAQEEAAKLLARYGIGLNAVGSQ